MATVEDETISGADCLDIMQEAQESVLDTDTNEENMIDSDTNESDPDAEEPTDDDDNADIFAAAAEEQARASYRRSRRDEPEAAKILTMGMFLNFLDAAGIGLRYDVILREANTTWRVPDSMAIMRSLGNGDLPASERVMEQTLQELADEISQNHWDTGHGLESLDMIANYLKKLVKIWNRHNPQAAIEVSEADVLMLLTRTINLHQFNPIIDLLGAQRWDGVDRLPEIYRILGLESGSGYSMMVRQWLKQCIAGLFNDGGFGLEGCLVLQGPQGLGKTSFFRKLALRREWFLESLALPNPDERDSIAKATRGWLGELGEIDSTFSRSEVGALKAFLTTARDIYRPPYGRAEVRYPRKTTFCGGCNSADFLVDSTGNRRFWVIPVRNIDLDALAKLDALQLWTQIYSEVEPLDMEGKAECFRLDEETKSFLNQSNKEFERSLPGEDLIREDVYQESEIANYPGVPLTELTVSAIQKQLCDSDRTITSWHIGRVLSKLGYTRCHISVPTGYQFDKKKQTWGYRLLLGSAIRTHEQKKRWAEQEADAARRAEERRRETGEQETMNI